MYTGMYIISNLENFILLFIYFIIYLFKYDLWSYFQNHIIIQIIYLKYLYYIVYHHNAT